MIRREENCTCVPSWVSTSTVTFWNVSMKVKSLVLVMSVTLICIVLLRTVNNSESKTDFKEEGLFWPQLHFLLPQRCHGGSNKTMACSHTHITTDAALTLHLFLPLYPVYQKKTKKSGFPGGSVMRSLPANSGDSFDPWSGKIPSAVGQLSPWSRTREPQPEKACTKTQHSRN